MPRGRPGFDSRPMQLALLLSFPRLSPGPKKDKRSGTLSPSGMCTAVSRETGGDTIKYINEDECVSPWRLLPMHAVVNFVAQFRKLWRKPKTITGIYRGLVELA